MSVMRRAMDIVPVDFKNAQGEEDRWAPFFLVVQDPGKVRKITTVMMEESSIVTVALGEPPKPKLTLRPAIVFEIDPEGEKRKRHFLWLAPGVKINFEGNLEFRADYIDEETRNPMFLYEAFPTKKG